MFTIVYFFFTEYFYKNLLGRYTNSIIIGFTNIYLCVMPQKLHKPRKN